MDYFPASHRTDPRITKQFNLVMPESLHSDLKQLVSQMPSMSMQRFIMQAIMEKMETVARGRHLHASGLEERPEDAPSFLDFYKS